MRLVITSLLLFLVGCTTSSETMTELSMGMTKSEVFRLMGKPDSISATNGTEYLTYTLRTETSFTRNTFGYQGQYFVRLVNGRVDSYGKVGDFDTTKDPTLNLNIRNR
jgi:outer membrane protein assembly factor BamE (lipoprotein component of BamABCDE complex)